MPLPRLIPRLAGAPMLALALAIGAALTAPAARAQPSADQTRPLDADARAAVLGSLGQVLRDRYIHADRGAKAAEGIADLRKSGAFDGAATAGELAALIREKVGPLVEDRHFNIRYVGPEITAQYRPTPTAEETAAFHEEVRLRGHELPKVEWLPGNVGYLRVNLLLGPDAAGEKVEAAMDFLADTDALIIDVRDTPGGDPAGVANLIGYLVAERTHLLDIVARPASNSSSFYAEPKPGSPNFAGKPVYVLTSKKTGSGAEELSYDLQAMKRATLVGETTYGAANPGGFLPLAEGFAAFIPTGRVVHAVTKTNWEGTGVKPDVAVPADQALAIAHRLAVESLLGKSDGLQRQLLEEALAGLPPATGN